MVNEIVTKDETALQREGFEYYNAIGNERSYAKVAVKFGKSISTIENWGKMFKWPARVEEREVLKRSKATEQAIVEKELDYTQRNLKIIKRGILEHAKDIQSGKLKTSYKTLIELTREETKLRTGIDSTIEVNHRIEIAGMTNEELREKIIEKAEKLKEMKKAKHFDQIEAPVLDAEYKEISEEEKK